MVTKTYGSSALPGDVVTVLAGSTVDISLAFNAVIGIVGGMDTGTGTASEEEVKEVTSVSKAQDFFGDGSELHRAVKAAYANGVQNVFAVGVTETSELSESISGSSHTLANTPAFDPNFNAEHSISFNDSGGTNPTTNVVYDDTVSTPSDADTANVNPRTGDVELDAAAAGSYTVDYDYGDYDSAIQNSGLLDEDLRMVAVLSEADSVVSTLATELDARDDNFDFMRGVVGGKRVDESAYADSTDDQRIVRVQTPHGVNESGDHVRMAAPVGGLLTSAPLGESRTGTRHGQISGIDSLLEPTGGYSVSDLETFANDHQLLPVEDGSVIYVAKDNTTSTDGKFDRVYSTEIVDEAVELSHQINDAFIGDLNTDENRAALRDQHVGAYAEMRDDRPSLLDGFAVTVSEDPNNSDEVDVEIGLDVVDVMDTIDVTLTVGEITRSATVA